MATPPLDPIGQIVRNALLLQRVTNTMSNEADVLIQRLFDDIAAQIARIDPSGVRMVYRKGRVDKLLKRVREMSNTTFDEWHAAARSDLVLVGKQQARFARDNLIASLGAQGGKVSAVTPTANHIKAIIDTQPFQGETLRGWAQNVKAATVRRVRQEIQTGMLREESIDDLVRRVRGRHTGRYRTVTLKSGKTRRVGVFEGGVLNATTKDVRAITRTAVTDVANSSALATYKENADITEAYQYVATLDARTTPICASLDGKVFRYDDPGAPRPPQHYQCRSFIVPVVDWKKLGLKPPPEGTRAARDPKTGKTIQVRATTTYGDWLKKQPKSVQDKVLGKRRGELFRQGKLDMSDLVRGENRGASAVLRPPPVSKPKPPPTVEELELHLSDVLATQRMVGPNTQNPVGTTAAMLEARQEAEALKAALQQKLGAAIKDHPDLVAFSIDDPATWGYGETIYRGERLSNMLHLLRISGSRYDLGDLEYALDRAHFALDKAERATARAFAQRRLTEVIDNIPEARTFVGEEAANRLIGNWATTSGDHNPLAVALQKAAKTEFGLDGAVLAHFDAKTIAQAEAKLNKFEGLLRTFLRAQYNDTQQRLQAAGVTHLTLARGADIDLPFHSKGADSIALYDRMALQPMSSFSSELRVARDFAVEMGSGKGHSTVFVTRVAAKDVLSSPHTGLGCLVEHEVVVLSRGQKAIAIRFDDSRMMMDFIRRAGGNDEFNMEAFLAWLERENRDWQFPITVRR